MNNLRKWTYANLNKGICLQSKKEIEIRHLFDKKENKNLKKTNMIYFLLFILLVILICLSV